MLHIIVKLVLGGNCLFKQILIKSISVHGFPEKITKFAFAPKARKISEISLLKLPVCHFVMQQILREL